MTAETDHQSGPLALPFYERSSVYLAVEIYSYLECRQVGETDTRMSRLRQHLEHAWVIAQGQKPLGQNLQTHQHDF
jgi:hypothetical protein